MEKIRPLHSRYNPEGEAERYIDSLSITGNVKFFILIEPGMGYLSIFLHAKFPAAKILSIYAERPPESNFRKNITDNFWSPMDKITLRDFLENEIPDVEAKEIKIIEWRPSLAVYGKAYCKILSETVEFIKQSDASARTGNQFSLRWFKNFFRNLNLLSKIIYPAAFTFPVLITGAGPGLEETIPEIRANSENLFLIAVSSSAAALKAANIEPDLIIATDGGNWALLHLYECFRKHADSAIPINNKPELAVNLTAAIPSQCANSPMLILCDNSLWQSLLFRELKIPTIILPQRGTVSASALDLAFSMTNNNVYLTGVDLSNRDIQSHVRPYSFDRLWEEKAGRFCPVYSQVYGRSVLIREGGSHNIYASWFARQLSAYPKRLFTLGTNHSVFNGLKKIKTSQKIPVIKNFQKKPALDYFCINREKNPAMRAAYLLKDAIVSSQFSGKLCEELRFLAPTEPDAAKLGNAVLEITRPFWNKQYE